MPLYSYLLIGLALSVLAGFHHWLIPIVLFFWIVLGRVLIAKFRKPEKTSYEKLFEEIDEVIAKKS